MKPEVLLVTVYQVRNTNCLFIYIYIYIYIFFFFFFFFVGDGVGGGINIVIVTVPLYTLIKKKTSVPLCKKFHLSTRKREKFRRKRHVRR